MQYKLICILSSPTAPPNATHLIMSGEIEFVDEVPQELICSICLEPAKDPQQTRCTCSNLYCSKCVQSLSKTSNKCPTCRSRLKSFPDGLSAVTAVPGACGLMNGQHSEITSRHVPMSQPHAQTAYRSCYEAASPLTC